MFILLLLLAAMDPFAARADLGIVGGTQLTDNHIYLFAGINSSLLKVNVLGVDQTYGRGIGLAAGFSYSFGHYNKNQYEIGLLFSQRHERGLAVGGSLLGTSIVGNLDDVYLQASYLELPVIFRISLDKRLNFGIGAYVAYPLTQFTAIDPSGNSTSVSFSDAGFKQLDFGVVAAVGIILPFSYKTALLLDVRGQYGIQNLVQDTGGLEVGAHYWTFQFLAGIRFGRTGHYRKIPGRIRKRRPVPVKRKKRRKRKVEEF